MMMTSQKQKAVSELVEDEAQLGLFFASPRLVNHFDSTVSISVTFYRLLVYRVTYNQRRTLFPVLTCLLSKEKAADMTPDGRTNSRMAEDPQLRLSRHLREFGE